MGNKPHKRQQKKAAQAAQTLRRRQHLECWTSGDKVLVILSRRSAAQAAISSSTVGNKPHTRQRKKAAQAAQTLRYKQHLKSRTSGDKVLVILSRRSACTSNDLVINDGKNRPHMRHRRFVINNTGEAAQAATNF